MSAVHCCQAAIPALRETGGGAIVNFSSTAATSVFPDGSNSAYAAVKAALAHFTRHLAAELGPDGIRANMVAPGITLTGRLLAESKDTGYASRAAEVPMRRLGTPDDVAKAVEFLVSDLSALRDRPLRPGRRRLGPDPLIDDRHEPLPPRWQGRDRHRRLLRPRRRVREGAGRGRRRRGDRRPPRREARGDQAADRGRRPARRSPSAPT